MKYYVELNQFGIMEGWGSGPDLPPNTIEIDPKDLDNIGQKVLVESEWQERPTLDDHTFIDNHFEIDVPEGSWAFVSDNDTRTTLGRVPEENGKITFDLEDIGDYFIEIYPNGPHYKKEIVLNVN